MDDFICREGKVIKPGRSVIDQAYHKWNNTLIGKIITEKHFKASKTMKEIDQTWSNLISIVAIRDLGNECFSFTFQNEKDKVWVMDSRPWLVYGYLLVLTEWRPNIPPSKLTMITTCPFWVQAHDVPYELMSIMMGVKLGQLAGEVLVVDFHERKKEIRKYLRIRVVVDVTKRLATGCWLYISEGNFLWISFRYEELPKMCYRCGVIGHSDPNCNSNISVPLFENNIINYKNNERVVVLDEGQVWVDPTKRGYGSWLKEEIQEEEERLDDEDEEEDGDP